MAGLGHLALGAAAGRAFVPRAAEMPRLAAAMGFFATLSMLPDLDVIGFRFGVEYGAPWGHRGATHSLFIATAVAGACGFAAWMRGRGAARVLVFAAIVAASHGLLDAMTDGGRGVALLWPFDLTRYFLPWRPIPVAPIGAGMISARGLHVTLVEAAEFSLLLVYAFAPRRARDPGR
jgi:inner membrane protein